jgi:hypothetical protein
MCQILQSLHVQNQLWLYTKTFESQFFKYVFLIPSISIYAGSDTRDEALELYEDMPWPCYLGISPSTSPSRTTLLWLVLSRRCVRLC